MIQIDCERVSYAFRTSTGYVEALHSVSLRSRTSEFLAIAGPSGSGKTTLLRMIAGLLEPTGGSLRLHGLPAANRESVRCVFQEHNLFPWMNVLDNTTFGLRMAGVPRAEAEARARELLKRMGLGGREKAWPSELSTGMKQRVAVIRAFISDPALLLMDEPFGAVDAQTRACLQQELLDLWTASRVPVVFVTHDVDEAILLAQRVILLDGPPGRIHSEHEIPFEYPRPFALTMSTRFLEIKRKIYSGLGMQWEPVHAR